MQAGFEPAARHERGDVEFGPVGLGNRTEP